MRLPSTHSIKRKVLVKYNTRKTENRYKRVEKWIMWKSTLTKWICLMLSVKDGHRPFQIMLKPGFQLSVLDVRLRRVIVISVKAKLGNFEEQTCFFSCLICFFFLQYFKQALGERYGRKKSRSCSFACFEEHCTGWPCLFQNGNWKILSVSTRLKGEFPLLRCAWPVKITPHFSRTVNSSLQGHLAYQEFKISVWYE